MFLLLRGGPNSLTGQIYIGVGVAVPDASLDCTIVLVLTRLERVV